MKFYHSQHFSRVAPGRGANVELEGKIDQMQKKKKQKKVCRSVVVFTPGMTNAEKIAAYQARPMILKFFDALVFPALIFIFAGLSISLYLDSTSQFYAMGPTLIAIGLFSFSVSWIGPKTYAMIGKEYAKAPSARISPLPTTQ